MLRLWTALAAITALGAIAHAQKDILRDIARALKEPKPVAEVLARRPIAVVANDETVFNLFRSFLPTVHQVEFVPLSALAERADELAKRDGHIVIVVDRARGDFPLEQRHWVPYDLTLVRRQDVVVAATVEPDGRVRAFLSAPSFHALKEAVERFATRKIREVRDLQGQQASPVPLCVVVTNAGRDILNAFAERAPVDFVWVTPDDLDRVRDLLVTETEIYLLVPPVSETVRTRLPFNLTLLAPNQSVAVRRNKGGNYWQVLLYGSFPDALRGLLHRFADPLSVPERPLVITHPVVTVPQRLLVVPFGDINIYRDRVGDFASQVFRAVQGAGLAAETLTVAKPPEPLLDWRPFQDGTAEAKHIAALAKQHGAGLVLIGRLLDFDTQTTRRQELSSRPSPAADRRIWEVKTVRTERVIARLQARLHDGATGETLWTRTLEGVAEKQTVENTRQTEAAQPPLLDPERRSLFVYDDRLYAAAATAAVAELIEALRTEIAWQGANMPTPTAVATAPIPTDTDGLVGQVEMLPDGTVVLYLDIGANQGLKVGDLLQIYRVVTVKTERKTVQVEEELGRAKVIAVFAEACKAQMVPPVAGQVTPGARARSVR